MPIRIIAIGKGHGSWIVQGIERYEKRLKRPFDVSWILLPHSARDGNGARTEESERILQHNDLGDFVVLLDEKGRLVDSPALSRILLEPLDRSKRITIIIGGAYGVDERVRQRADIVWSLSPLVFPHQLVRLLLIEQLYRAQEIARGNPYHHE
jgi:23S rRNA (pseudouridine1915-N3)-methyltransferase